MEALIESILELGSAAFFTRKLVDIAVNRILGRPFVRVLFPLQTQLEFLSGLLLQNEVEPGFETLQAADCLLMGDPKDVGHLY